MALLFLLDILLSIFAGVFSTTRLIVNLISLAAHRFGWLFDLTYWLAFDFYLQLQKPATKSKK